MCACACVRVHPTLAPIYTRSLKTQHPANKHLNSDSEFTRSIRNDTSHLASRQCGIALSCFSLPDWCLCTHGHTLTHTHQLLKRGGAFYRINPQRTSLRKARWRLIDAKCFPPRGRPGRLREGGSTWSSSAHPKSRAHTCSRIECWRINRCVWFVPWKSVRIWRHWGRCESFFLLFFFLSWSQRQSKVTVWWRRSLKPNPNKTFVTPVIENIVELS